MTLTPIQMGQLMEIKQYERGIHSDDIGKSVAVFLVFEFFVFLLQGKFGFFSFGRCSWKYWAGLVILTGLVFAYLQYLQKYLVKKFSKYRSLFYRQ